MNCVYCGAPVEADTEATYGVVGVDGSLCCEDRVPGCLACEDGEAHPHDIAVEGRVQA